MKPYQYILPADASLGTAAPESAPPTTVPLATTVSNKASNRRRRILEKPALIACLECRRTRVRCAANFPETCERCHQRGYTCEYPPHSKLQKDDILRALERSRACMQLLEERNRDLVVLLNVAARASPQQDIQSRLLAGEGPGVLTSWLSTFQGTTTERPRPLRSNECIENAIDNILHLQSQDIDVATTTSDHQARWTGVTVNTAFLETLIVLWTRNTQAEILLFRFEEFLQIFHQSEPDASSLAGYSSLLNAICGMACNYLQTDLCTPEDHTCLRLIRSAFIEEAMSSINHAEAQNLTVIWTLIILCLVQLGDAQARSASTWLHVAAELLRGLEAEAEAEAEMTDEFDLTRWCIHSLAAFWSAYSMQNPCSIQTCNTTIVFDSSSGLTPQYNSTLQRSRSTDSGARQRIQLTTPSTAIYAAGFRARLSQVSHSVARMYHGSDGWIGIEKAMEIHNDLLALLHNLVPNGSKQVDALSEDHNFHVLHILYYGVAVSLWSPLVYFAQVQHHEGMLHHFRDVLLKNSRNAFKCIEGMLENSRTNLLPINLMCVVNICDSIARWSPDLEERQHVVFHCLKFLSSNTSSPKFCSTLMRMFLAETIKCKLVDEATLLGLQDSFKVSGFCSVEEALDATTRPTYLSPFSTMIQWLSPDFVSQWSDWMRRNNDNLLAEERRTIRIADICN